mmetsp:Transcript_14748/g.51700  ORF Transcript_14748/g.51700 Transcript_14748/m.51700 type:complete len:278 (+) Transcript_14748:505-1338(+)
MRFRTTSTESPTSMAGTWISMRGCRCRTTLGVGPSMFRSTRAPKMPAAGGCASATSGIPSASGTRSSSGATCSSSTDGFGTGCATSHGKGRQGLRTCCASRTTHGARPCRCRRTTMSLWRRRCASPWVGRSTTTARLALLVPPTLPAGHAWATTTTPTPTRSATTASRWMRTARCGRRRSTWSRTVGRVNWSGSSSRSATWAALRSSTRCPTCAATTRAAGRRRHHWCLRRATAGELSATSGSASDGRAPPQAACFGRATLCAETWSSSCRPCCRGA